MNCPRCQAPNPAEAKLCMRCGASLAMRCPACGTELPFQAQFCFQCGHRLTEAAAPPTQGHERQYIPPELLAKLESARASGGMRGERRTVTMLFCDVQGSTAAAARMDPEEWAEIMNGAFQHLIEPVYRYEGTLARLLGDAILAFFGAPIAHEDDAQRAVLAALDILQSIRPYCEEVRRRWGLDFNVRIGLNTGLVVVGEVGSDLRVDYTPMGDAVNLAARMEQTALPGTIQITESTHRLVGPLFEFEDLGGVEVKGRTEPLHAYRVLRPRAEPGSLRGLPGLDAPLVGRDREMGRLRSTIVDLRLGRGQVVSVMGEAGLGKSRLVAELRRALVAEGLVASGRDGAQDTPSPLIAWYEGRCLSYDSSRPYALFARLLTDVFDLHSEEPETERYARVKARMGELMQDRVLETAPFVATLLGLHPTGEDLERVRYLEPPQLRERVFRATGELVERLAAARPLVLVLEDIHWIDPTSLELLERLLPLAERAAVTMVGVFRPWRQEPSWRFHEVASRDYAHRYTAVLLEPLGAGDARTLVANLLHVEDLPERVRALILAKAEGNPFFLEEVIRSLLDARLVVRDDGRWRATREIEAIAVPDTLAGVINARLDRLDEESKRVAQTASVIGREFPFDALAGVHERPGMLEQALVELQRRELIRETSRAPRRAYMFKHVVTQETAYGTLLFSRRRDLHGRLADWLERTDPQRAGEIARHLLEARQPARALPYLVEAGDRAARAYSTAEAIGLYTQALEVLETEKDLPLARRAYEGLGGALALSNQVQRAVETYRRMIQVGQQHDDAATQVSAMNKLSLLVGMRLGQFTDAVKLLEDSEGLARAHSDIPGLAELHMIQCNFCTARADFPAALAHLTEAARIGRELDLLEPKLYGMTHVANTQTYLSRFDDAWQTAQEAFTIAQEAGHRQWKAEILTFSIALHHVRNGDVEAARRAAQEGLDTAAQIGATTAEAGGAVMLGQLARLSGDYERAIGCLERALQAARAGGMTWTEAMILCTLGAIYLDISPQLMEQAREFQGQALQVMEQPGGGMMGASNWAEMGFCHLALGELEQARELFQNGLTVPTPPMHLERPRLLVGSAFVELAQGRAEAAAALVQQAREYAEERGMRHLYPLVALAEAQVRAARGEAEGALASFAQAEELALQMGMRPVVWQVRAGAARLLTALGQTSEASAKRDQAQAVVGEIAGLFADEGLRALFRENAARQMA